MSTDQIAPTIIDLIDEGVITVRNGRIIQVNAAMARMAGRSIPELQALDLEAMFDPPPSLGPETRAESADETPDLVPLYESSLKMADGQISAVAVSVHLIETGEDPIAVIIVRNIDERKKMQQELLKSRQLESIAALSGGIAHDYNNLLTAIMGNISLALTGIPEDDAIYDWLSQAQDAALIAKELTNRLITFSKGGLPQKEIVAIAGLIESATEFALSGSNIIAEFDIRPDLWSTDVDRTQIGQAFHNLVINAREAMPDGGKISVRAGNTTIMPEGPIRKQGRFVLVAIQDTGTGIPADVMDRIFDPYFSTKEMGDQRGMGLGLSIANSIIEKHDGRIIVASPPGEGALFQVYLPASTKTAPAAQPHEPSHPSTSAIGSGRILVMDDEAMIRKLAGNMLGKLGFETEFACNGEEAVDAYEQAMGAGLPFDLVILDLTVKGGMGGKDTIRRLRELDPDVKAIVSSGYANDPGVTHFAEYGFCGVVAKPYRFDEIRQQLKTVLGR